MHLHVNHLQNLINRQKSPPAPSEIEIKIIYIIEKYIFIFVYIYIFKSHPISVGKGG